MNMWQGARQERGTYSARIEFTVRIDLAEDLLEALHNQQEQCMKSLPFYIFQTEEVAAFKISALQSLLTFASNFRYWHITPLQLNLISDFVSLSIKVLVRGLVWSSIVGGMHFADESLASYRGAKKA